MNVFWKCKLAWIVDALMAVGSPGDVALKRFRTPRAAQADGPHRRPPPRGRAGADWLKRARQPERNGRRLDAAHLLRAARGGGHLERHHHQPPGLG